MKIQPRESRSHLIGRYIEHWLNGDITKQSSYADDVRLAYWAMEPHPEERNIKFHSTGDAVHDTRENRQVVMRRIRREIKFECDFEEAAIEALPTEGRADLLQLLSARYGLLAVPIPGCDSLGVSADLARFAKEFGEAVTAVSELLQGDGVIDEHDSPVKLRSAAKEMDDLLAAGTVFRISISAALKAQESE
ncbi:MAG: hypothetical protein RPU13_13435 [Candidatus Sedimenticola sp. (ex Thyasira tokunagai)]